MNGTHSFVQHNQLKGFQAKQFTKPSTAFVRALACAAAEEFIVFKAMAEREAVTGTAVLRCARFSEYYLGWYGPQGRKQSAACYFGTWRWK